MQVKDSSQINRSDGFKNEGHIVVPKYTTMVSGDTSSYATTAQNQKMVGNVRHSEVTEEKQSEGRHAIIDNKSSIQYSSIQPETISEDDQN